MKVVQKIAAVACSTALACSMGAGMALAAGSYTPSTMPDTVVAGDIVHISNGATYVGVGTNKVAYTTPKSTTIKTANIRATANGVPVTTISATAFKGCTKLKTVKVNSTKVTAKSVLAAINKYKKVKKSVTTIKVKKSQLAKFQKVFKGTGIKIKVLS
ncbi:MAG: hypothetical protein ACI36Y_03990 [Coriobacteriales bacterium]